MGLAEPQCNGPGSQHQHQAAPCASGQAPWPRPANFAERKGPVNPVAPLAGAPPAFSCHQCGGLGGAVTVGDLAACKASIMAEVGALKQLALEAVRGQLGGRSAAASAHTHAVQPQRQRLSLQPDVGPGQDGAWRSSSDMDWAHSCSGGGPETPAPASSGVGSGAGRRRRAEQQPQQKTMGRQELEEQFLSRLHEPALAAQWERQLLQVRSSACLQVPALGARLRAAPCCNTRATPNITCVALPVGAECRVCGHEHWCCSWWD